MKQLGMGYTTAPGNDMTPMQMAVHRKGIDHQNWQTPGSKALYPGRENYDYVDYSNQRGSSGQEKQSSITRMPQTEEEVIRNRAETQMTSNMIKNSLAELREKLTQMKHNKEFVQIGI